MWPGMAEWTDRWSGKTLCLALRKAAAARGDPRLAEVVPAYVELKPGREANEDQLIDFGRSGLATRKAPRKVRFVSHWPVSGAAKLQRFLPTAQTHAIR